MNELSRTTIHRVMGPLLGLLAFIVYMVTLSPCAYPTDSAYYIAHYSGIAPKLSVESPVFYFLTRLITLLGTSGSLSVRLNIFSALCSATTIFLLFQIVSHFVFSVIELNRIGVQKARVAAMSAGLIAALTLLFSSHFWTVSNRFHVTSFNILLLLGMLRLFVLCLEKQSKRGLIFFAFIYGICIVEYPPFIPFLFLFAPYLIFWLWAREELDVNVLAKLTVSGLLGLCFYFVTAGIFFCSEIQDFMSQTGYFHMVWSIGLYQYNFLSRILPEFGWLIVVVMTVVPWLTCLFLARRGLNEDPNLSLFFLHVMMTVIAVIGVLNLAFIREPIEEAHLYLVLPYVLIASSFGYLAAYWYLLPGCISSDSESGILRILRNSLGRILLLPFLGMAVALSVVNHSQADARSAKFMKEYCAAVVEEMDGADWLIINGGIEKSIQIRAYELNVDLNIIDLSRFYNEPYVKYVGAKLNSSLSRTYAEVGLMPMLSEWVSSNRDDIGRIVAFNNPDLWHGWGMHPIPGVLGFIGAEKTPEKGESQQIFKRHIDFWKKNSALINVDQDSLSTTMAVLYGNCMRHMGHVANDLGVLMEDGGFQDNAFKAYQKAREIDPDNISALLNQSLMIQRGYETQERSQVIADMKVLEAQKRKRAMWSLNRLYGYVRHPEVFARQGYMWALSGRPDMAVAGLKRTALLVPESSKSQVKNLLANIHMMSGQTELSKIAYEDVLDMKPEDHTAIMGITRLALMRGDVENAKLFLEKAEQAGVSEHKRNRAWAVIALLADDVARARVIIEDVLSSGVPDLRDYVLLSEIVMAQGDNDALLECLRRMEKLKGGAVASLDIQGNHAFRQNDVNAAVKYWEKALLRVPTNAYLVRKLLFLDMRMHNTGDARRRARRLLSIDPSDSLANYVMGGLMLHKKKYELAESAFKKSVQSRPTIDALNDLAWTLLQQNKTKEAEDTIMRAIEIDPKHFAVWDTLGEIMMAQERLGEAEKAFHSSLLISRKEPRVIMHMAELYIKKGDKARASELLDEVFPKIKLMPGAEQKRLIELRKLVR